MLTGDIDCGRGLVIHHIGRQENCFTLPLFLSTEAPGFPQMVNPRDLYIMPSVILGQNFVSNITLPFISVQGGSWISTGDEASRFARYAFRRHFFQHCGFRLARTVADSSQEVKLPVRLVDSKIFVQGTGFPGNNYKMSTKVM